VSKDHGSNQTDLGGYPWRRGGKPGKKVGPEKDTAEHPRGYIEAHMKPVGYDALENEAAGEGAQGEQAGKLEHNFLGPMQTEMSFSLFRNRAKGSRLGKLDP
jgi:hypothetical protein